MPAILNKSVVYGGTFVDYMIWGSSLKQFPVWRKNNLPWLWVAGSGPVCVSESPVVEGRGNYEDTRFFFGWPREIISELNRPKCSLWEFELGILKSSHFHTQTTHNTHTKKVLSEKP